MPQTDDSNADSKPRRKRGCRYFFNLAVAAFVFFWLVSYAIALPSGTYPFAHPKRGGVIAPAADYPARFEEVEFTTHDGLRLSGWYLPSENGATISFAHGIDSSRSGLLDHARPLIEAGYGVLLFDLRTSGRSEGDTLKYDGSDVLAAYEYLKNRDDVDAERIGAFGFSLGAIITLQAAAVEPGIKSVFLDGIGPVAFADTPNPVNVTDWTYLPADFLFWPLLGLRTGVTPLPNTEVIAKIAPRPVYLVGTSDFEGRVIAKLYEAAHEPKTHWSIPDAFHGTGILLYPEEYKERLVGFFDEALMAEE